MGRKEISVPHDQLANPQTSTPVVEKAFKDAGLNLHRHEADTEDDHAQKRRIYKIKNVKYFDFGKRSSR